NTECNLLLQGGGRMPARSDLVGIRDASRTRYSIGFLGRLEGHVLAKYPEFLECVHTDRPKRPQKISTKPLKGTVYARRWQSSTTLPQIARTIFLSSSGVGTGGIASTTRSWAYVWMTWPA